MWLTGPTVGPTGSTFCFVVDLDEDYMASNPVQRAGRTESPKPTKTEPVKDGDNKREEKKDEYHQMMQRTWGDMAGARRPNADASTTQGARGSAKTSTQLDRHRRKQIGAEYGQMSHRTAQSPSNKRKHTNA